MLCKAGIFRYHPRMTLPAHDHFMRMALKEAEKAAAAEEVPAGCIIVNTAENRGIPAGAVIGRAHNQTRRLTDTILYVTKEPCSMCAGAIVLARVPTVVYGVPDPKRGGAQSIFNILDHPNLNHRCEVVTGVMEAECREVLQAFFRTRRREPRIDANGRE